MGKKSKDSFEKSEKSKGSVGLRKTLAKEDIGGGTVSVSAGLSVDVLPIDVDISLEDDNLNIKGEVGLPGDVVSVGGGVVVDINTGEVVGGSASASVGGATVEVSQVECERSISISYFGISIGYSEDICGKDDDDNDNENDNGNDNGNNNNQPLDPNDFPATPSLLIFTRKPVYRTIQAPSSIVRIPNPNTVRTETIIAASVATTRISYSILEDVIDRSFIGGVRYPTGRTNWCCLSENINDNPATVLPRWRFNVGWLGNLYEPWIVTGGEFLWEDDQISFSSYSLLFQAVEFVYISNPQKFIKAHNYLSFEGIDKFTVGGNFGSNFFGRHFRASQKVDRIIPVTLGEEQRRPIPSGRDMNECCDASISLMRKIAKVLGCSDDNKRFPFQLPESFRNIEGNEPKQTDIDDYPEAFGYLLDRIDELIGQFNIDIEIEDTDPTTKGNQTAKISIGNISEGIAEIIGLIYGLGMSQKIGTEASVKSLITLGMIQRTITEIDAVTEEIFDHLEIPMKEVEREIDLEFTPGVKNFDAFFKPSKERVKVPERLNGKNAPTLQDQMDILIQAATIIKSRGFKKVNPYQDIGAQVMGNLASGLLDKYVLKNSEDPNAPENPESKKKEWDEFIEDVEENFRDYEKPGEIDLEKSDNPKIIKLNKPTPTPAPKPTEGQ